jgi:cation diffusion facilitator CzcD-associated flavoprotein CzcO
MPETERYLNFVAYRFDLRKDIQFKTRVTAASYDEAIKRWSITTDQGETFQAQYFIIAAVWEEQAPRLLLLCISETSSE